MSSYLSKLVVILYASSIRVLARRNTEVSPNGQAAYYSLPFSKSVHQGAQTFNSLLSSASNEGFLSHGIWGNDCFTQALRSFSRECRDLLPTEKSRLAFMLTRCQLIIHGLEPSDRRLQCGPLEVFKICVSRLSDRENTLYVEMLSQIDSACLFIQNLHFEKHAEMLLNDLVNAGSKNHDLVHKISQELMNLLQGIQRQNNNASAAAAAFSDIFTGHIRSVERQLNDIVNDISSIFVDIQADSKAISRFQESLRSDLEKIIEYQGKTELAMKSLLGKDITRKDVFFYMTAILALVLAGSVGIAKTPRKLFFVWIASSLTLERLLSLDDQYRPIVRKLVGVTTVCWYIAAHSGWLEAIALNIDMMKYTSEISLREIDGTAQDRGAKATGEEAQAPLTPSPLRRSNRLRERRTHS
jgi:hypothetical protein